MKEGVYEQADIYFKLLKLTEQELYKTKSLQSCQVLLGYFNLRSSTTAGINQHNAILMLKEMFPDSEMLPNTFYKSKAKDFRIKVYLQDRCLPK